MIFSFYSSSINIFLPPEDLDPDARLLQFLRDLAGSLSAGCFSWAHLQSACRILPGWGQGVPVPPGVPRAATAFLSWVGGFPLWGVVACCRRKQSMSKGANSEHLLCGACCSGLTWESLGHWKAQGRRIWWAIGVKARREPLHSTQMQATMLTIGYHPSISLGAGVTGNKSPTPWLLILLRELQISVGFASASLLCRQGNGTKRNGQKRAEGVSVVLLHIYI